VKWERGSRDKRKKRVRREHGAYGGVGNKNAQKIDLALVFKILSYRALPCKIHFALQSLQRQTRPEVCREDDIESRTITAR